MPKLILQGNGEKQVFELPANVPYRIGRSRHNHLPLNRESVSDSHCEVVFDGLVMTVTDLGSTNGTFINGAHIQKSSIHAGQVLQVGGISFIVEMDEQRVVVPEFTRGEQQRALTLDNGAACCYNHPTLMAAVVCPSCLKHFCAACVHVVGLVGAKKHLLCPSCHNHCNAYAFEGAAQAGFLGGIVSAFKKITGRFRN